MGIEPDWNVDALMKVETQEGRNTSIATEFIVRMLGLGICSDTMVRASLRVSWICYNLPQLLLNSVAVRRKTLQTCLGIPKNRFVWLPKVGPSMYEPSLVLRSTAVGNPVPC